MAGTILLSPPSYCQRAYLPLLLTPRGSNYRWEHKQCHPGCCHCRQRRRVLSAPCRRFAQEGEQCPCPGSGAHPPGSLNMANLQKLRRNYHLSRCRWPCPLLGKPVLTRVGRSAPGGEGVRAIILYHQLGLPCLLLVYNKERILGSATHCRCLDCCLGCRHCRCYCLVLGLLHCQCCRLVLGLLHCHCCRRLLFCFLNCGGQRRLIVLLPLN